MLRAVVALATFALIAPLAAAQGLDASVPILGQRIVADDSHVAVDGLPSVALSGPASTGSSTRDPGSQPSSSSSPSSSSGSSSSSPPPSSAPPTLVFDFPPLDTKAATDAVRDAAQTVGGLDGLPLL